jgi:hypothetical protein
MSIICTHSSGFFSCCSVKLHYIINYINLNFKLPDHVDSSKQFSWYKKNQDQDKDITFKYFEHYDNIKDISFSYPINYDWDCQFVDYSKLNYNNIIPVIKKYFSPSIKIINIINNIEKKYNLIYDNICVLFYRGNDKNTETELCNYDEYLIYANLIIKSNPNILFLIQSDETEFIDFISKKFPNNSFYFNDEIRHISKTNSSVDIQMKDKNYKFSKYYLAITIIMSKCKYIICGSGNCSMWIMFYRENSNNVYQNLKGKWIIDNNNTVYKNLYYKLYVKHNDVDWKFIANEGDIISNIALGTHIRYGANGVGWIENINHHECFEVTNLHFNNDPAPNVKKILQVCTKC